ncbi:peptidase M28, partial [bacterium]|nr:peptidase M28 [bacterium]
MKVLNCTKLLLVYILFVFVTPLKAQEQEVDRLVGALLGDTPMISDLQKLCDEIGGRPTGSPANLRSVEWAMKSFQNAGVLAKKEAFIMPRFWLERSAEAVISGDVTYEPNVVSMTFSVGTPKEGLTAPLVDGGRGTEADFARLGKAAKGAFILVETDELLDINGLFKEYMNAVGIEKRAFTVEAMGVVYMSSRPQGLLYRHNASFGPRNKHPMLVMEREAAKRALRLLRSQ